MNNIKNNIDNFIAELSDTIQQDIFNEPIYLEHKIKLDIDYHENKIININLGYDIKKFKDIKQLIINLNLDEKEYMTKLAKLIKNARTANLEQLERKCFLMLLSEKINNKNSNISININSIGYNTFLCSYITNEQYVNYNFIISIGNLEWMVFIKTPSNSYENGLQRTKLIQALFYLAFIKIDYTTGIKDIFTNEFIEKEVINDIIDYLNKSLDINLVFNDFASYIILYDKLKNVLDDYRFSILNDYYDYFMK